MGIKGSFRGGVGGTGGGVRPTCLNPAPSARTCPGGNRGTPLFNQARLTIFFLSLIASAYLMSLALGAPGYPWLSWVSLLPLFLAIRVFTPRVAMLAGGLWGGCLYVFSIAGGGTAILPGIQSCALLVTVPAVYAWVGTRLTRRVGFSPLLLGLGWVGVEFALAPLGLRHGLLASAQGGGALFQLVGGLLGYCFVAFLVAFATALLLSVATDARLKIPQPRYIPRSDNDRGWLITLTSSYVPLVAVLPAQPRAPPGWAQVSRAPR